MSTHLLVVDLRDDFDRVTQGLRHYEGRSPDASFVVLIPEQSAVIEESERNRGFAAGRKSAFLAAMQSNGIVVERLTVSARDVVDAVRTQVEREHFDEIIVASPPERLERFFGVDFSHRLQREFDIPVISLIDPKAHEMYADDFADD